VATARPVVVAPGGIPGAGCACWRRGSFGVSSLRRQGQLDLLAPLVGGQPPRLQLHSIRGRGQRFLQLADAVLVVACLGKRARFDQIDSVHCCPPVSPRLDGWHVVSIGTLSLMSTPPADRSSGNLMSETSIA